MIKQLLFASSILAAGSTFSQQGLEKIIVEKYYVSNVERAAQRNQNKAVGAITLLIADFCSSGIFGILGI